MIALLEDYKVQVSMVTVRLCLWNGESLETSFFLRPGSASRHGVWESLGERLNDPQTRFLACRIEGRLELLNLDTISLVEVSGTLPEVAQSDVIGALRLPATVSLRCGRDVTGEFVAVLPPERRRLSDLLNVPTERFLLFVSPISTRYLHRDAIARVVPAETGGELLLDIEELFAAG